MSYSIPTLCEVHDSAWQSWTQSLFFSPSRSLTHSVMSRDNVSLENDVHMPKLRSWSLDRETASSNHKKRFSGSERGRAGVREMPAQLAIQRNNKLNLRHCLFIHQQKCEFSWKKNWLSVLKRFLSREKGAAFPLATLRNCKEIAQVNPSLLPSAQSLI